jgi:ABC-type nitrate/sulfonate/bicarbonate transport system permease component
VLLHAIPLIVLAPVLVTVLGADSVPVLVAAFSSFFSMFVSTSAGFDAPTREHLDVLTDPGRPYATT